jgi:hypothetical protein
MNDDSYLAKKRKRWLSGVEAIVSLREAHFMGTSTPLSPHVFSPFTWH